MKKIDDSELEDVTGAGGDADLQPSASAGTIPGVGIPGGSAGGPTNDMGDGDHSDDYNKADDDGTLPGGGGSSGVGQ